MYGPWEQTSAALRHWYGLPVRNGTSRLEVTAKGKRATGAINGHDFISVEIESFSESGEPASVTLNYLTPKGLLEIPFVAELRRAEPVSVEVHAVPGDPFATFQPVKVLWAVEYRNGCFAFTRPLSIGL